MIVLFFVLCKKIILFFLCLSGSSTACILILNRDASTVHTANLGDSGFVVVRHGVVVHKSDEQQHYFNTPYQLGVPPPEYRSAIADRYGWSLKYYNIHI